MRDHAPRFDILMRADHEEEAKMGEERLRRQVEELEMERSQ